MHSCISLNEGAQICTNLVRYGDCRGHLSFAGHSGAKTQDGSTDSATAPPVCEVSQNDHEEEKLVPAPWLGPEAALQFPGTQSIADGDGAWHTPLSAADDLAGFHAFHCCISSSKLKAIYSLTWYGRLLMAAGKGGMCSLFSVPEVLAAILHACMHAPV